MIRTIVTTLITVLSAHALNLNMTIQLALEHSVQLQQIELDKRMTSLKIDEKKAHADGKLTLQGSYDHFNLPRTLAPLTPTTMSLDTPSTDNLFSVGVNYTVPLFTGFSQTNDVHISELEQRKHTINKTLTNQQIIYNVKNTYLAILALQERKAAMEAYHDAQKALATKIEQEVSLGRRAPIDLMKMQSDLITIRSQVKNLTHHIAILQASLAYMAGQDVEKIEPIAITVDTPQFTIEHLDGLDRVRLLDVAMAVSDKKIAMQKSKYYPQILLRSYYGQNMGFNDDPNGDFNTQELWNAGVTLQYDLLDFGERDAAIELARVEKLKIIAQRDDLLAQMRKELIAAIEKIYQSIADFESAQANVELLRESAAIEQVRYDNGVIDINDLLMIRAQEALMEAKFIEAKYTYQQHIHYIEYLLEKGTDS